MHTYEKLDLGVPTKLTDLSLSVRHTISCPRCGWTHPVPIEYTDWKEIAGRYEKAYLEMSRSFFTKLIEAGIAFDVPLVEYFEADKQILLAQLKDILNGK